MTRISRSRHIRRTRLGVLALESRDTPSAPIPVGPEFQVNTYTPSAQAYATTARAPDGSFVIAWASDQQDGSELGVFAQRYDSAGNPQGAEFPVNSYTANRQYKPCAAVNSTGDFVIAWEGDGPGDSYGIFARQFNSQGVPLGTEFRVNTITANSQSLPAIAMNGAGDFIITWHSYGQDTSSTYGIFAQRYNASGIPEGSEIAVNQNTNENQFYPSVGISANGSFVIAWEGANTGGDNSAIYARRFDANGVPLSGDVHVSTNIPAGEILPRVLMNSVGDYIISWTSGSNPSQTFERDIYARRFNAIGTPQGTEFQVNSFTPGQQDYSNSAIAPDGRFIITWTSYADQDGSGWGAYAQAYTTAGQPDGGEFRINTFTAGNQARPAPSYDADGNLVIAWDSQNQDGDLSGIFAQRYAAVAPPPPAVGISISDATVIEANAGTSNANFTVTLSAVSSDTITVQFLTSNNSAVTGSDFLSTGGTLSFAPGETSKTLSIPVIGDRLGEADETFFVNLRNAVNAGFADNQGVGTIFDDEPRMTISDVALTEGKSGTKAFVFTVTLSAAYDETVSVSFQTANGTATTSNNDYIAQSGSLTFNPGETSKTITILVKGDKKRESNEEFYVDLFGISSNALLLDSRGIGTILNDD